MDTTTQSTQEATSAGVQSVPPTPTHTRKTASAPFDKSTADVILRSRDSVDFRVHKLILSLSSSFFETMFSLDQPPSDADTGATTELPVIEVTEESETVDALLRFCYPVDNPSINNVDVLDRFFEAAAKYDVVVAKRALAKEFSKFLKSHAKHIFAISCKHGLEVEAVSAASSIWASVAPIAVFGKSSAAPPPNDEAIDFSSTTPGKIFGAPLETLSAGVYYRLVHFKSPSQKSTSIVDPQISTFWSDSSGRSWLCQPSSDRGASDIIIRSSDGLDFYVHDVVLRLYGADKIWEGQVLQDGVYHSGVSSTILSPLLELCYPPDPSVFSTKTDTTKYSCRVYGDVLSTADKMGMHGLMNTIRARWPTSSAAEDDPLGMYLIAARLGWTAEAKILADRLLDRPLRDVYSYELERTPAAVYHRLLEYHHNSQAAILSVFQKYAPAAPPSTTTPATTPSSSAFGSFGTPSTPTRPFGTTTTSAFGAPSTTGFGAFGAPSSTAAPAAGVGAQPSFFGATQTRTTNTGFGSSFTSHSPTYTTSTATPTAQDQVDAWRKPWFCPTSSHYTRYVPSVLALDAKATTSSFASSPDFGKIMKSAKEIDDQIKQALRKIVLKTK